MKVEPWKIKALQHWDSETVLDEETQRYVTFVPSEEEILKRMAAGKYDKVTTGDIMGV